MDPTSGDQLTAASKGAASKSIDDILNTLGAKNQQNKLEEQQAAFELASADFSDVICAACELGGDMICCDGHCLRSFHPKCIDLNEEDIPEDAPFLCVDCSNGIHRCFVCKHFELESELVKCSLPFCGKFYHKKVDKIEYSAISFFIISQEIVFSLVHGKCEAWQTSLRKAYM